VNNVTLRLGDCLEILPTLADKCADAIITDLPYGTTACSWDVVIPFAPMWEQVKRLCKGAFVTTASQPFTSLLVASNLNWFKYEWIWRKTNAGDFMTAKIRPRKKHENVVVFSKNGHTYNPQMEQGKPYIDKPRKRSNRIVDSTMPNLGIVNNGTRYPDSVQLFSNGNNAIVHPTQKPVALYEYLIKTYTNPGDTVLDFCMGSGTTIVAAIKTGRNAIGIEKRPDYFEIAQRRVNEAQQTVMEFA
jgi:DNA modification methylase